MKVVLSTAGHFLNKKRCTIFSVDVCPRDGAVVVSGGQDGMVRLWRVEENETKEIGKFSKHSGAVLCVRYSPGGEMIASASDDGSVVVWGVEREKKEVGIFCRRKLTDHKSDVSGVAWCSKYLATGSYDGNVHVYSAEDFSLVKRLERHEKGCKGVEFGADGGYLSTYGDEGELFLYGKDLAKIGNTKKPFKGVQMESFFGRMSWSPDGKYVACGLAFLEKRDVIAVLSAGLTKDYTLVGHTAPVETVAFNPKVWEKGAKGYVLATGSQDRSIAVWMSSFPKPLILLKDVTSQPIMDLRWSRDGLSLTGCGYDGRVFRVVFEESELGTGTVPEQELGEKLAHSSEFFAEKYKIADLPGPVCEKTAKNNEGLPEKETAEKSAEKAPEERKKIIPRLIEPLSIRKKDAAEGERVVLFAPRREHREFPEFPCARELCTQKGKTTYNISVNREEWTVQVRKNGAEWFSSSGLKAKMVAAEKETLVVVCEPSGSLLEGADACGEIPEKEKKAVTGVETVWIYNMESCSQVVPAQGHTQVILVDVLDGRVLIVLPNRFKILDVNRSTCIEDSIESHGGVVNITLDRKYCVLALYTDGSTHFYDERLRTWAVYEVGGPCVFSDTYSGNSRRDCTFEYLENACLVGIEKEEWTMVEKSIERVILAVSNAQEATPGTLNRVEGVIRTFLEATENRGAHFVYSLLKQAAVRSSRPPKGMQHYIHQKLAEIENMWSYQKE